MSACYFFRIQFTGSILDKELTPHSCEIASLDLGYVSLEDIFTRLSRLLPHFLPLEFDKLMSTVQAYWPRAH